MKKNVTIVIIKLFAISILLSRVEYVKAVDHAENEIISIDTLAYLNLPVRSDTAVGGSEFLCQISDLSLPDRERAIVTEILSGNVPAFARTLKAIEVIRSIGAEEYRVVLFAVCDYMAIGSDQDYLYVPMTPSTAQYLADRLDCLLPTKDIVDIIYTLADVRLDPRPIPPSDAMTSVPVFKHHTDIIRRQFSEIGYDRSAIDIIAGHKKDIIVSNKIDDTGSTSGRVVIYGWHKSEQDPIQPVYAGHSAAYADYSHGVRLISNSASVNGREISVTDMLRDSTLAVLLSDEGIIDNARYPIRGNMFDNTPE
jgi:hypothetical protein